MGNVNVITAIRKKFSETGSPVLIMMAGRRSFQARIAEEGVYVSNLDSKPFLPWKVFTEAVSLIEKKGGRAMNGNAINFKLGQIGLPVDSVEGHIARTVYGKEIGESVSRRITPVAAILIWAGVCRHEPGELILCEKKETR